MTSRTPSVIDRVRSGPQMALQEFKAMQHCLSQAQLPPLAPSQPSPATAQSSVGAQDGQPGGAAKSHQPVPGCPDLGTAAPRGWAMDSVWSRAKLFVDRTPWRRSGGTFWLINHESSHGSCPLLWPNGSRGLIIEQRADISTFRPFHPWPPS